MVQVPEGYCPEVLDGWMRFFKEQEQRKQPPEQQLDLFPNQAPSDIVRPVLPEDDEVRSTMPMFDGLLAYFPNALAYVSQISRHGSLKHNPGQPMHWSRGKSTDHENKIVRHLIESGTKDSDGFRHSGYLAWRALALLQTELEEAGECPPSRASRF